jgi:hypothetical protein
MTPTLSERIAAARTALLATKDALAAVSTKEDLTADDLAQMDALSAQVDEQTRALDTLEHSERALAARSVPVTGPGAPGMPTPALAPPAGLQRAALPVAARPGTPLRMISTRNANPADVIVRAALVALEQALTFDSADNILARRYPGSMEVAEVHRLLTFGTITRAATNPAMTNVATWAQELVREGYAAFMDPLTGESVVPQLPLRRFEFDGLNKITIPGRNTVFPTDPNLAGAFRAEGAPIRVGRTSLISKFLTPKSLGVIGTFTRELLRRSTPSIEAAIREWILADTATMLDTAFLSNHAGNAVRPAGMQAGLAAGDTAVSGGNTGADILNDMRARVQAMTAQGLGRSMVWVMNTKHAWGVRTATTPTGTPQFPNGPMGGMSLVDSINVPIGTVFLIDASEIAFAGGAPSFEGSNEATIHEESGDPNTDEITGPLVLPLVTGAPGAGVVATPQRSFFQTNTAGIRAMWELDWLRLRAGAVQTITGVGW